MSYKDTIYRQDAIDAINAYLGLSAVSRTIQNMTSIQEILENLPSAEPERWSTCFDCPLSHGCPVIKGCTNEQAMQYAGEIPDNCPLNKISAEPRKKGKWIKIPEFCGDDVSGFIDNHFSCSECKKEAEINSWGFYILSDFCPNCGADMRGEQE